MDTHISPIFPSMFSAPTDCTQYFTALAGTFQSYNFNNGVDTVIEKQNYNVCFRQAEGKKGSYANDVTINSNFLKK